MNLKTAKKIVAFISVAIWIILIFKISQSGGSMRAQLPKCIFTTITLFAILNILIKIIEHLEKKKESI